MREELKLSDEYQGDLWRFLGPLQPVTSHHHSELELNLVVQGVADYLLDDRRYTLRQGTLVWLFPGQNHVLLNRSSDFSMWILVAKPELVQSACRSAASRILQESNPSGEFCRHPALTSCARLGSLFQELCHVREDKECFNAGIQYALLSAWAVYCAADQVTVGVGVHPAVEGAVRLLRQEGDGASLKQMGQQFGLSASRLSTLFKQQTGVALVDFRIQQRLERFWHLYGQGTQMTVTEAALEAGFGSYPQFYRVFCRKIGCSPAEYRRKVRQEQISGRARQ